MAVVLTSCTRPSFRLTNLSGRRRGAPDGRAFGQRVTRDAAAGVEPEASSGQVSLMIAQAQKEALQKKKSFENDQIAHVTPESAHPSAWYIAAAAVLKMKEAATRGGLTSGRPCGPVHAQARCIGQFGLKVLTS